MREQPIKEGPVARIRQRLSYANVMATLAVFIALGGGAWAVAIGRNDVGAREIAKNAVGSSELKNDKTKGKDVDESSLAEVPRAARAGRSDRADRADAADRAATADNATQFGGLLPAAVNTANLSFADDNCDPATVSLVCASTTLEQPRASDVLVLATATMFGDAGASGSCIVDGPGSTELAGFIEVGQQQAIHDQVDLGDGFIVPGLFRGVPAGTSTFSLECAQDTGDLKIGGQTIVAVRLSG